MYKSKKLLSKSGRIEKYQLFQNEKQLTYQEVVNLWKTSTDFRKFYTDTLNASQFEAYFWETPPINISNFDRPFEFILMESKMFPRLSADTKSFREHFSKATDFEGIVTFPNLGRNAVLVVPRPISDNEIYVHFAKFLKNANDSQIDNLWQCLAVAIEERLNKKTVWVSTAGMSVYWLHIRLDDRPKYYRFSPYKTV